MDEEILEPEQLTESELTEEQITEQLILSQPDSMELVAYSRDVFRNVVYTCIYSLSINKNLTTVYDYTDIIEDGVLIGRTLNGFTRKEYPIPEIIAMNQLNITNIQSVVRS